MAREKAKEKVGTRPSRPIRCDVWIVDRMRYPIDQQTDRLTDTNSCRGDLSHIKSYERECVIHANPELPCTTEKRINRLDISYVRLI